MFSLCFYWSKSSQQGAGKDWGRNQTWHCLTVLCEPFQRCRSLLPLPVVKSLVTGKRVKNPAPGHFHLPESSWLIIIIYKLTLKSVNSLQFNSGTALEIPKAKWYFLSFGFTAGLIIALSQEFRLQWLYLQKENNIYKCHRIDSGTL